ncbi:hypothetical protein [Spiroplasma cantharicola]|uniref:HTH rpiR-type domain-containing protein n=1 Tax=Spiroplasma cantharicola TaxID=362837 RepID=A0A0M3SJB1_9MOLU|nr:hypothetical protein [Spiroplasma cantharicola]ALD66424.1 hypothetical protein SCANT_v1c05180 [Spiroplasma cantharicola]
MNELLYKKIEKISKNDLNNTFKIVSQQILKDFWNNSFKKQKQLAKICNVSEATITNFSKTVSVSGYRELVIILKLEYKNNFIDIKKSKTSKISEIFINFTNFTKNTNFKIDLFKKRVLEANKEIVIMSSYETSFSSIFLSDLLNQKNYKTNIFDLSKNLNNLNQIHFLDYSYIFIFTGNETESLYNAYEFLKNKIDKNNIFILYTYLWEKNFELIDNKLFLDQKYYESNINGINFFLINLYKYLSTLIDYKN